MGKPFFDKYCGAYVISRNQSANASEYLRTNSVIRGFPYFVASEAVDVAAQPLVPERVPDEPSHKTKRSILFI